MQFQSGSYYHIFNQGNNRQQLFLRHSFYDLFLDLYIKHVHPHCQTLNYVLMPNHFHFMVYCDERCAGLGGSGIAAMNPVSEGLRRTLSAYSKKVNMFEGRSGSMFRQNTKAKSLDEGIVLGEFSSSRLSYTEECFYYIHKNPLRAGLVNDLSDWPFSAYHEYNGRVKNGICDIKRAGRDCGFDSRTFYDRCHSDFGAIY
jgi:REP element-mobilizing transposase RayT